MSGVLGALLALASLATLPAAYAEDKPATEAKPTAKADLGDKIEEVVVTARRREENLQSVPISVTAITGEQLAERGITDLVSLGAQVPSFRAGSAEIQPKRFAVSIRGFRASSTLITDDPPVSIYFAEVGNSHPFGITQSFYDIQSVQVLKGPQGTLFGKNTTGGAVLIEPNKPSLDGLDGNVTVGVGNYNMSKLEGMLNAVISDTAAVRIAFGEHQRDGYTKTVSNTFRFDSVDDRSIRAQILWKPVPGVTTNTMVDYLNDHGSPTNEIMIGVIPQHVVPSLYGNTGLTFNASNPGPNLPYNPYNPLSALNQALARQKALGPRLSDTAVGSLVPVNFSGAVASEFGGDALNPANCFGAVPTALHPACRGNSIPKQSLEVKGFTNNTSVDLGAAQLKNIIGYREVLYTTDISESFPSAAASGAFPGLFSIQAIYNGIRTHMASDELQLSGKAMDDKLDWITGAYVGHEIGHDKSIAYQFLYLGGWGTNETLSLNNTHAVFLQGDYRFSDQWKLTAGARETWDHRWANNISVQRNGTTCKIPNPANPATFLPLAHCSLAKSDQWQAPTWTLTLSYQADVDTMYYGTLSRGYHSGGFSARAVTPSSFEYQPEYVNNAEVGVKSDWHLGGMPVRTNAALWNAKYNNQQVQSQDTITLPGQILTYTTNVGQSRYYGAEFELTAKPTPAFEVGASASYLHMEYTSYSDPVYGDLSNIPVGANGANIGLPHWQGGLNAKYTMDLEDKGSLILSADVILRQHTVTDNAGLVASHPPKIIAPGVVAAGPAGQVPEPGYGLLNLRAEWKNMMGSQFDLAGYVQNAGNKTYLLGGAEVAGSITAIYAPPRMIGLDLTYRFGKSSNGS